LRVYVSIITPMLGASFATAAVLLSVSVVRLYDLSVAMTNGGPGFGSEVPAKFVMDHLFERQNLGLATAAATSMLITVAAVAAPFLYWQAKRQRLAVRGWQASRKPSHGDRGRSARRRRRSGSTSSLSPQLCSSRSHCM